MGGSTAPELRALSVPRGYIETLDGWRAVAIILVIVSHQFGLSRCIATDSIGCRLITAGNPGVQLFFALSGFLICSRLLDERQLTGAISLRGFYIRRAFRIFPAAFSYLAVVSALGLVGILSVGRGEVAASALFARNYLPPDAGWYTTHFWSLAVEEHFYLVWPALALMVPPRWLGRVALGAAVAVAAWRSLDGRLHVSSNWFLPDVYFFRTDTRLDGLFAGSALAILFRHPLWRERAARWLPSALLVALLPVFLVTRSVPAQVVISTMLVAGTVAAPKGALGTALEWSPLRWVGRLSYSLYLWHELFTVLPGDPADFWHRLPGSLAPTLLVAWLGYHLIERPLLRIGHRFAPPVREGRPELVRKAAPAPRRTRVWGQMSLLFRRGGRLAERRADS